MKNILSALMLALLSSTALAKDLGVMGQTYPIAETDFLTWIQAQIEAKTKSSELQQWQVEQAKESAQYADRPIPVSGLTPALQNRSWFYDPSLTLTHDLLDAQGHMKLPAGARLNPLDHITWSKALLFFNGDDPDQVNWAMQMNQQLKGQTLLILTQGSISQQKKFFNQRIYFDQNGVLVQKFGISHLPASIEQVGKQLKVSEIKL